MKQAAMDLTPLNSFKECLFKPASTLKELWKQNPEDFNELFKTFQDDDIDEFENQLVNAYYIHLRSRKQIYYLFRVDPVLGKNEKGLILIILFLSIFEQILKKQQNMKIQQKFQEDYNQKKFSDLDFKQHPREFITKMITKMLDKQTNEMQEKIPQILFAVKREDIYSVLKKKYQAGMEFISRNSAFEQQYKNMKNDIQRYEKDSLECYVQKALVYTFEKRFELKSQYHGNSVENLLNFYEKQGEKQYSRHPKKTDIDSSIKKIRLFYKKDRIEVHSEMKKLKQLVCILDIFQLERLIQKSKTSGDQIQDKDIILVIGLTGSGKSTTILKFSGASFRKIEVNGTTEYEPEHFDHTFEKFRISSKGVSCTNYITSAPIPNSMQVGLQRQKKIDKPLYVVDTPGFEDTRGSQMDIANQIGTVRALQGCHNIRLVVILSNNATLVSNSRGGPARTMATLMNKLCINFNKISNSVRILVNETQKVDRKVFLKDLGSLLEHKTQNKFTIEEIQFLQKIRNDCGGKYSFISPVSDTNDFFSELLRENLMHCWKLRLRGLLEEVTKR